MSDDLHPLAGGIVALVSLATSCFSLYCSYIAFVGGTIPIFGWHLDGGAVGGVLWLIFVTPVISMVSYWLAMLLAVPIAAIFKPRK